MSDHRYTFHEICFPRRVVAKKFFLLSQQFCAILAHLHRPNGCVESKDDLKRRIAEAAQYAPLDQLALSPQCGFSSTVHGNNIAVEDQRRKLALVVETAREVWGD